MDNFYISTEQNEHNCLIVFPNGCNSCITFIRYTNIMSNSFLMGWFMSIRTLWCTHKIIPSLALEHLLLCWIVHNPTLSVNYPDWTKLMQTADTIVGNPKVFSWRQSLHWIALIKSIWMMNVYQPEPCKGSKILTQNMTGLFLFYWLNGLNLNCYGIHQPSNLISQPGMKPSLLLYTVMKSVWKYVWNSEMFESESRLTLVWSRLFPDIYCNQLLGLSKTCS